MWQRWIRIAPVLLVMLLLYLAGCSKNPTSVLDRGRHQFPETELTYAPVEADTASFRVHLYWYGYDNDGQVVRFRFAIDSDTSKPFIKWHITSAHDSVFTFQVAPGDLVGGHVFWVSAVDDDGRIDPTPAKRYFSVHTLPPTSQITGGPAVGARTGSRVTFSWNGTDPDGGPVGNPVAADSFEYILLRPGTSFDGAHTPLPNFVSAQYWADFLTSAAGSSLPAPYDDWKWTATSSRYREFTALALGGYYVFAERALDDAGAHDVKLTARRNVRDFFVATSPAGQTPPGLRIWSDALFQPLSNYASTEVYGAITTIDFIYTRVSVLDSEPVTFSWSGEPGGSAYPVAGFTSALDDTTTESWSLPDPSRTSITLPADIRPGMHHLYIRVVDIGGGSCLADLTLEIVHAAFKDPGQPPAILYVDDFAAPPGDWSTAQRGSPNFPADDAEDDWWTRVILTPLAREHGMTFDQWDPVYEGATSFLGRVPPPLEELARHRVVIWSVDLNNTIASPVALWSGLSGSLAAYVRGGGTLILTGFTVAANAAFDSSLPYRASSFGGLCSFLSPGLPDWRLAYFLRDYMGIDGAKSSDAATRREGARDFVGAQVTPEGIAFGFQSAEVDTGGSGTGAKWYPYAFFPSTNPDTQLAPGLPKVEGWKLEEALGCHADESGYRREFPALPLASPIFTYHGVNKGVLQDGTASPREGLVVGIVTQAHDQGNGDGSLVTSGNTRGVTGRMAFLGFPIYYMKDAEAYAAMHAAFAYVNGSPTLAGGMP